MRLNFTTVWVKMIINDLSEALIVKKPQVIGHFKYESF